MFCAKCEKELLNENEALCSHCGTPIANSSVRAIVALENQQKKPAMSLGESVSTCIKKWATFKGRASRAEFWLFFLFYILFYWFFGWLLAFIVAGLYIITSSKALVVALSAVIFIAAIVFLIAGLSVTVRRLHDIGKSGWWLLLVFLIPIGNIILIIWHAESGSQEENKYGLPVS